MVLRKSFYIRWSAGRSPRVHEVNPGRDPSRKLCRDRKWKRNETSLDSFVTTRISMLPQTIQPVTKIKK